MISEKTRFVHYLLGLRGTLRGTRRSCGALEPRTPHRGRHPWKRVLQLVRIGHPTLHGHHCHRARNRHGSRLPHDSLTNPAPTARHPGRTIGNIQEAPPDHVPSILCHESDRLWSCNTGGSINRTRNHAMRRKPNQQIQRAGDLSR